MKFVMKYPSEFDEEILKAAKFSAEFLKISDADVTVEINLSEGVFVECDEYIGECAGIFKATNPSQYEIELDCTLSIPNMIKTLFHEMTHAKQEVFEEFYFTDEEFIFQSKIYPIDLDYSEFPWEIEAFTMQEIIYKEYYQ